MKKDYAKLADKKAVGKAARALEKRGIRAEFAATGKDAFRMLVKLIPAGSDVMTAGSTTLDQIGFTDLLKSGKHRWHNLKDSILAENDADKQAELRRKSVTSECFIGSVHAVTQAGDVLVASASGSQIPSYAFSSMNVVWVVGAQKIVPKIKDGLERIRRYCLPLEDRRMKGAGYSGSTIGKILIFEREINPARKITLIFVNEKLGF